MLIKWTESAEHDLAEILSYFITEREEERGKAIIGQLIKSVSRLESSPLSGRPGRISGTREIIVRKIPYIIVYHLPGPDTAEILKVIHSARLWSESMFDKKD